MQTLKWVYTFQCPFDGPPPLKTTMSLPKPPSLAAVGIGVLGGVKGRDGAAVLRHPQGNLLFLKPCQAKAPIGWLSHGAKSHKSFMQEFPLVYQQWSSWLPLPLPPNVSKTKKSDLQRKREFYNNFIIDRVPTTLTNEFTRLFHCKIIVLFWSDCMEKERLDLRGEIQA